MMLERFSGLQGKTLSTLARNKKFDILLVTDDEIIIKLHSSGKTRPITRRELEKAWKELKARGVITQKHIMDSGCWNSAFVTTFLAQIPGVSYRTRPVTLFLKSWRPF